jgi:hypothetical protein
VCNENWSILWVDFKRRGLSGIGTKRAGPTAGIYSVMPCTKMAGVTIGISRNGLSAKRSALPEMQGSARNTAGCRHSRGRERVVHVCEGGDLGEGMLEAKAGAGVRHRAVAAQIIPHPNPPQLAG